MTGNLSSKRDVWQMVFYYYENGKRKTRWESTHISSKDGKNKKQATEMLAQRLSELNAVYEGDNFIQVIEEWLVDVKRKIRVNTYSSYVHVVNTHLIPYFSTLDLDIQSIRMQHIQNYCNYKLDSGLSVNTVIKHRANLSQIFKYAIRRELIATNPVLGVELPNKVKFEAHFYSASQIDHLVSLCRGTPIESAVVLAANFGLRREEVLGLKWSAIDLDEGVMTIRHTAVQLRGATLYQDATKSKASRRSFPILGRMKEYLKALKYHQEVMRIEYGSEYISNDYVCKWDNGKPMRPDTLSNKFRRLIEENNLPPLTFHGLRHSCASILLSQGCSLKQIQDWLGHEDIQTTADIYSHLEYRSKTGIADILDRSISKNPHNHQENQTF